MGIAGIRSDRMKFKKNVHGGYKTDTKIGRIELYRESCVVLYDKALNVVRWTKQNNDQMRDGWRIYFFRRNDGVGRLYFLTNLRFRTKRDALSALETTARRKRVRL